MDYGKLQRYDMINQSKTKTALDPTFYSQKYADGTISTPPFNFNAIVSSEIIITDVGMQEILIHEEGVRARSIG